MNSKLFNRWELLKKEINIDQNSTPNEQESLLKLCKKYENIFYIKGDQLSYTKGINHKIQTPIDLLPIDQENYRLPQSHKQIINEAVQELLENNIVKHSNSPWNSPLLVIQYAHTIGDAYPLPRIDDILDQLSHAKYFTIPDLASGYH